MSTTLHPLPRVIAHRGGADEGPFTENSREAFVTAAADGFRCECDVWTSRDGQPVVMHDHCLERTTLSKALVGDLSAEEIRRIGFNNDFSCHVPLLSEVAGFVELVEVKPANARDLVRAVCDTMGARSWRMIAFDPRNLEHALEYSPTVQIGLLTGEQRGVEEALARKWPGFFQHALITDSNMKRMRDAGLFVGTWTVNDRQTLERIAPLRPHFIISDRPRQMWRLLHP